MKPVNIFFKNGNKAECFEEIIIRRNGAQVEFNDAISMYFDDFLEVAKEVLPMYQIGSKSMLIALVNSNSDSTHVIVSLSLEEKNQIAAAKTVVTMYPDLSVQVPTKRGVFLEFNGEDFEATLEMDHVLISRHGSYAIGYTDENQEVISNNLAL